MAHPPCEIVKNEYFYRISELNCGSAIGIGHSELLTELLSRFLSQNEFFAIFKFRVEHHFSVIFGKFGISKFPKFPNFSEFFRTFSKLSKLFPKFPNFFIIIILLLYYYCNNSNYSSIIDVSS